MRCEKLLLTFTSTNLKILVSLKRISPVASNLFSVTVKSITPCDICHCSETEENNLIVLSLSLKVSIPDSITERLKSVQLSKFCLICETRTSFSKENLIISTGSVVIIIDRFSYIEENPIRNPKVVRCCSLCPYVKYCSLCNVKKYSLLEICVDCELCKSQTSKLTGSGSKSRLKFLQLRFTRRRTQGNLVSQHSLWITIQ